MNHKKKIIKKICKLIKDEELALNLHANNSDHESNLIQLHKDSLLFASEKFFKEWLKERWNSSECILEFLDFAFNEVGFVHYFSFADWIKKLGLRVIIEYKHERVY